jgi:hypothetical protein
MENVRVHAIMRLLMLAPQKSGAFFAKKSPTPVQGVRAEKDTKGATLASELAAEMRNCCRFGAKIAKNIP